MAWLQVIMNSFLHRKISEVPTWFIINSISLLRPWDYFPWDKYPELCIFSLFLPFLEPLWLQTCCHTLSREKQKIKFNCPEDQRQSVVKKKKKEVKKLSFLCYFSCLKQENSGPFFLPSLDLSNHTYRNSKFVESIWLWMLPFYISSQIKSSLPYSTV